MSGRQVIGPQANGGHGKETVHHHQGEDDRQRGEEEAKERTPDLVQLADDGQTGAAVEETHDEKAGYQKPSEEHQEYERGLVDALFDSQADLFLHQAFDEEQEDYSAVEDGDRQQVKDAEIQADDGADEEKRRPAFFAGGAAYGAADADGAVDLLDRDFALDHLLEQFKN